MPQKPTKKNEAPSNSPSLPARAEKEGPEVKKSFREQMGPAEAIGIPCLVTIILIILFMVFIGVVVKLSLNYYGL